VYNDSYNFTKSQFDSIYPPPPLNLSFPTIFSSRSLCEKKEKNLKKQSQTSSTTTKFLRCRINAYGHAYVHVSIFSVKIHKYTWGFNPRPRHQRGTFVSQYSPSLSAIGFPQHSSDVEWPHSSRIFRVGSPKIKFKFFRHVTNFVAGQISTFSAFSPIKNNEKKEQQQSSISRGGVL